MKRIIGICAATWVLSTPVFAGDNEETLKATVVENKGVAPAAAAPAATGAGSVVTCSQGNNKRTVSITSQDPAKGVPCEVHYKKETEQPGHDQMIYSAANELNFCEAKARAFVEKLTGMGWTCN